MIEAAICLFLAAFVCEFIDSSMGMMYGTILAPVLIIAGFNPLLVVPSILLSQALGGFSAGVFHHKYKNVTFQPLSRDSLVVYMITVSGIIATLVAVATAINIPKLALNTYIGILVLIIGVLLLSKMKFCFSWKKISAVAVVSSFNKGLSGGGFGPIVTSGQVAAGRDPKRAIGSTVLAEAPICIVGFLAYLFMGGMIDSAFILPLCLGALAAAPVGAYATSKFPRAKIKLVLGALTLGLGIFTLLKIWVVG